MAEFLQILAEQYDYPQLAEEVLKELSQKEFNTNDVKGPKSVSIFLTKISELCPHLVINQMTMLVSILDSEVLHLLDLKVDHSLTPLSHTHCDAL